MQGLFGSAACRHGGHERRQDVRQDVLQMQERWPRALSLRSYAPACRFYVECEGLDGGPRGGRRDGGYGVGRGPGRGRSLGKFRGSYRWDLAKHERKVNSSLYCTALQFFLFMYWIHIARSQALS